VVSICILLGDIRTYVLFIIPDLLNLLNNILGRVNKLLRFIIKHKVKILFIIIIILLLGAYCFRWTQLRTQKIENVDIIILKDKWTGQTWTRTYGYKDGLFHRGELEPSPAEWEIDATKEKLLSSSEYSSSIKVLEDSIADKQQQIDALEIVKRNNLSGHNDYVSYATANKDKYVSNIRNSSSKSLLSLIEADRVGIGLDWDTTNRYHELEAGIPDDIITAHQNWSKAKLEQPQIEKSIPELISNFNNLAREDARSKVMYNAWLKKNIATGVWAGALVLVFIGLGFSLIKQRDSIKKRSNYDL
jgi:hypothetical protein